MGGKPRLHGGDENRTIYCNDADKTADGRFVCNYVSTAKYTMWNFIPKNLFEQFKKVANSYFLLISLLQQIPGISPTGRYTTALPLCLVLLVTAIKEAYEDYRRHQQDKEVNNRKCLVLRAPTAREIKKKLSCQDDGVEWRPTLWADVEVGDMVKVVNREPFPADLIVLGSSGAQGICYIETSQLDGETNLKIRQGIAETADIKDEATAMAFDGVLNCEGPNNRLYSFKGSMDIKGKTYPLETKQTLLRGAVLRNTQWIIGLVSYSGHETKQLMNASAAPHKRTNVDKTTNVQIVRVFFLLCFLALACSIGYNIWMNKFGVDAWYLDMDSSDILVASALQFLTFLILFNNLIPISLYVTIEMVKLAQAILINTDRAMYYEEKDTPALARTSNLNEELGQVEYIFSDKTGTLTRNMMEFRKVSIAGISYGYGTTEIGIAAQKRAGTYKDPTPEEEELAQKAREEMDRKRRELNGGELDEDDFAFDDVSLFENLQWEHGDAIGDHPTSWQIHETLSLLSVCHTVIPEVDPSTGKMFYEAASPDESALVSAAKFLGYNFKERTPHDIGVLINGKIQRFEILNNLEFTSTRKRMGVICRGPDGKIKLYLKGADSVMIPRLSKESKFISETNKHLVEYASEGLRTLVCAYREIPQEEYDAWKGKFHAASVSLENREQEVSDVCDIIEKDVLLLGATAIEDKLQEGVPDAIATLAEADIKIWVLTGDKQETAINIGYACALLTDDMTLIVINEETQEAASKLIKKKFKEYDNARSRSSPLGLIIDGFTLAFALEDSIKLVFLELCKLCKAVVCCRVSPLQKALVVTLVKENQHAITLAIGDGANDVSMIQAAHVGIGISGEEGLQAARSADYAIAQFKYLKRLLLVHGRYSYQRIAKVIVYSFYKNITLYLTQMWFTFNNGFSGQTHYEQWSLSLYNVAFTSLPIIAYGIFNQDVAISLAEEYPQLYIPGQKSYYFNQKVFWKWVATSILHSLLLFYLPTLAVGHSVLSENGQASGLWVQGTITYTCIIITVNLKIALETSYWTALNHITTWGSILVWFLFMFVYSFFFATFPMASEMYMMFDRLMSHTPLFWAIIVIVPTIVLFRDYTYKTMKRTFWPEPYHIIQEIGRMKKNPGTRPQAAGDAAVFLTSVRSKQTGFAFDNQGDEEELTQLH